MTSISKISFFILFSLILFSSSCSQVPKINDDQVIISEVILHILATNSENGTLDSIPDKLFVLPHTRLRESDLEIIDARVEKMEGFRLEDFKVSKAWDASLLHELSPNQVEFLQAHKFKPNIKNLLQISSIAYHEDQKQALVYVSFMCGGECGYGILLHFTYLNIWTLTSIEELWVS